MLSQWSYPNLKVAPCRYSGSLYQNDLILCAHNYASHFGKLKTLQPGDTLLFTDMDDQVVSFQMVEQEILEPDDEEAMTTRRLGSDPVHLHPGGQTASPSASSGQTRATAGVRHTEMPNCQEMERARAVSFYKFFPEAISKKSAVFPFSPTFPSKIHTFPARFGSNL